MNKSINLCILIFLSVISFNSSAVTPPPAGNSDTQDAFYTVRADLRRCIAPICGGWFVNPVNQKRMRCPDGSVRKECYVAQDKVNIPNLSDQQLAELHQAMSESRVLLQASIDKGVAYGLLLINNAWLAATAQKPKGAFVNLSNNGIVCITYPCPSFDAIILNRNTTKPLAAYDLSRVGADAQQLEQANKAVNSDDGLALAGRFYEVTGPGGSAQGIAARQFYLKLVGEAPRQCRPAGCSGQICSDTDVISTCEWRPEYACYRAATCARQNTGDCGWVMDDALRQCLEDAAAANTLLQNGTQ